jgi:hypothetical protein
LVHPEEQGDLMVRKGMISQIFNKWNGKEARVGIIDWCNSEGVLDLLEDIDPSIIDLSEFPELKEGNLVEIEILVNKEFRIISHK